MPSGVYGLSVTAAKTLGESMARRQALLTTGALLTAGTAVLFLGGTAQADALPPCPAGVTAASCISPTVLGETFTNGPTSGGVGAGVSGPTTAVLGTSTAASSSSGLPFTGADVLPLVGGGGVLLVGGGVLVAMGSRRRRTE